MSSWCIFVAITTEKTERNLSVHLDNIERVYFTENNFQKRLTFSKMSVNYT
jgi:hypothetical protein